MMRLTPARYQSQHELISAESSVLTEAATCIYTVDDFYVDPFAVRQEALTCKYSQPEAPAPWYVSNSPSKHSHVVLDFFSEHFGQSVHDALLDAQETSVGRFGLGLHRATQIICIHSDPFMWTGLIYLTPSPPPQAGTCFYRHKKTGDIRRTFDEERKDLQSTKPLDVVLPEEFREYEVWFRVDNIFNRLVLFDSTLFHSTERFFGNTGRSGRLTQTFFFNLGRSYRSGGT